MMTVPDNTLIFRGKNLQLAVVDNKGVVQLRDVRVGRTFSVDAKLSAPFEERKQRKSGRFKIDLTFFLKCRSPSA